VSELHSGHDLIVLMFPPPYTDNIGVFSAVHHVKKMTKLLRAY
jgi:hypothetical protein